MSWVRHNVSKSNLQRNAFFKVASQTPTPIQPKPEPKNEIVNPREIVDIFAKKTFTSEEYDAASAMKYIDAILYISYKSENENKIQKEIKKLDPKLSRSLKIEAVNNSNDALDNTQSHLVALQEFVKNTAWNTCLILEDDFTFNDEAPVINSTLKYFLTSVKDFDMLMLAANEENSESDDTDYPFIRKVKTVSNTSAYLVTRKYLFKLLGNLMKSSVAIKKQGFKEEYAMQNFWKQLSLKDNWYSLAEPLGSSD